MRILLVEDKVDFAETVEKSIRAIDGCEVSWKQSKASALDALGDEQFDVVLLDRRIPSSDGVLDDDPSHGWDVFQWIRVNLPGTSVWFLTATEDMDFSADVLNDYGHSGDIHSCGRADTVYRVFWKRRMTDCIAATRAFREEISRTDALSLSQTGEPTNLRPGEERILKLFCRKHGGSSVETRTLSGGLSGARVLRVTVRNAAGQPILTSIGKIGNFKEIELERNRFGNEIARLLPGSKPQMTADIALGASSYAGVFYGVVGTEVSDLFGKLAATPEEAVEVPGLLRENQAPWYAARDCGTVRVSSIRRHFISDVELDAVQAELHGIGILGVEKLEVEVALCVQHGDLHCANVLFDDRGQPMMIDYPETGRTYASRDPITLELCTIFHAHAIDRMGWPTEEQGESWPDISVFAAGAPFEPYLLACREWAAANAGSEKEIWAVGYAFSLRQLKYDDTDKDLARAIIRGCITALLEDGS